MKYIKIFEDFVDVFENNKDYDKFKVGDYVIIIDSYKYDKINFNLGDKCKIISIGPYPYIIIENEKGIRDEYKYTRIVPETEYYVNKYNL